LAAHRTTELTDWFTTDEVRPGVLRITEPYYRADYRCNVYLVRGRAFDVLIDTGLGLGDLRAYLRPVSAEPLLVCSHSHYDHVGSNADFPQRLIHPAEADVVARPTAQNTFADPILRTEDFSAQPWPGWTAADWLPRPAPATGVLNEGDVLDLGDRALRVLHTPGHSWGSVCLWDETGNELFCADTVYDGEIFDFLPCSDVPTYVRSMRRLRELPVRVAYPGHGPVLEGSQFRRVIDDYLARRAT
jgi:glyoxylase-like metal-dependent hydrolase (beta-lactamase superfamily II)